MIGCASFTRALLIFFNFLFWLCGIAMLGIGIWFLADKNISSWIEIVQIDSGDQYFKYAVYLFIAFGAFVFIVGFAGMCGAVRASKCLLGFYIFFVLLVIFAQIAAAVLLILYRQEIECNITILLQKNIKTRYAGHDIVRTGWDLAQIQFLCCGAEGIDDYKHVISAEWEAGQKIPTTCCTLTNRDAALKKPHTAKPLNKSYCFAETSDYHVTGCTKSLQDWAWKHSTIIIGMGIGMAVLEIFCIFWACCFWSNIGLLDHQ